DPAAAALALGPAAVRARSGVDRPVAAVFWPCGGAVRVGRRLIPVRLVWAGMAGDRTAAVRTAAVRTRGHRAGQCDGVPVVALAYLLDVTAKSPLMVYRLNMKERLHAELPPQPRQTS